ncbi:MULTISPECIES: lipocalin-like domain-containing protein [unclassified Ruegeria]|uniref:lipocalin-like domain-containing protein n=1 Tax=unclassified Ruegeria TaxID=2625375 RepID=UPI001488C3A7|nr:MULTISPECIES: lipocalin-like domain-containing protein [unclassified Ruegeria]NOD46160.1 iron ABC transporter permease [Ruegeria sp. HKCCD5849]NOD50540.1 iron ABC transporter permease [Ruegeria sp. HKCCD5851]NOD67356.1 iron ABC transporter permease [Ruegeria sp. HKCCD7303]NOE32942.1 iron ABC transporter permease [Ruegeria sp. HKCCD7318]
MNVKTLLLCLMTFFPLPLWAQGYAGLGGSAEGFDVPKAGYAFDFPKDHGPHPSYRIEWWYLTANLKGEDGRDYGIQWTLFRSALKPFETDDWQSPQIWMGHAATTTPDGHFFAERLSRGGIGQAGVISQPFEAWIDEWRMAGPDFDTLTLTANGEDFGYDLSLTAQGPLVFHGDAGYSVKSADGQASYYYSQPFYAVEGVLRLQGGDVRVTGQGWLDREWSSQPLAADQSGWDWFSLSFEGGDKMMAFRLRGGRGDFTSATWINADGSTEAIPNGTVQLTPLRTDQVAGREVPTQWRVVLPDRGVEIEVSALTPNAWMGTRFEYWEGPVTVTGSQEGIGYLEMTGY